jgi:hypothetical protein
LAIFARTGSKLEKVSATNDWYGVDRFGAATYADKEKFCSKLHET